MLIQTSTLHAKEIVLTLPMFQRKGTNHYMKYGEIQELTFQEVKHLGLKFVYADDDIQGHHQ